MLWMLRHADAIPAGLDLADAARPLSDKGRGQARAAGAALARLGVQLDACVSSPRVRALDTARLACEPLGAEITVDERLSSGPFDPREIAEGHGEHVMLVGHNPDFTEAVEELTGARLTLKKGGLAAIDEDELVLLLRPRELVAIAGLAAV